MAGQITPFMPLGSFTGNIDNITNNGAYLCEPALSTSSVALPFDGDFALYSFATSSSAYFKTQIAVDMANNYNVNIKIRKHRSEWSECKSVSLV